MERGLEELVVAVVPAPDCRLAYRRHGGACGGTYPSGRPPDGSTFERLPAKRGLEPTRPALSQSPCSVAPAPHLYGVKAAVSRKDIEKGAELMG